MNKKVNVKQLTCEAFQPYGSFANMVKPAGPKLGKGFYRDMAILSLGQTTEAAFSVMRVEKREKIINKFTKAVVFFADKAEIFRYLLLAVVSAFQ